MSLDKQWEKWNQSQSDEDFDALMVATDPIIDKAMTSYAPNASPAVRSKARVLTSQAVRTYDPAQKTKLQSYLYTQLQPLQRENMSYDTLHVPERVRYDIRQLNQDHDKFVDQNGREPNDDELADATGLSRKRIAHIRRFDRSILQESKFMQEDDDGDTNAMPATAYSQHIWQQAVYEDLGNTDKLIYDLRTGRNGRKAPLSVTDIGKKLHMTPSAVTQRLKRISDKMSEGVEYEQQPIKNILG